MTHEEEFVDIQCHKINIFDEYEYKDKNIPFVLTQDEADKLMNNNYLIEDYKQRIKNLKNLNEQLLIALKFSNKNCLLARTKLVLLQKVIIIEKRVKNTINEIEKIIYVKKN